MSKMQSIKYSKSQFSNQNIFEKNHSVMVAAVVVTHNRLDFLRDLLLSLENQTRKFDRIYVVDNASNDGTAEFLRSKKNDFICVIKNKKNRGGSGGFYDGTKRAYKDGFDWFWLIDDDVEAFPDALENLLKFSMLSGCIHGRRQNLDGSPYFWQVRFFESLGYWLPVPGNLFLKSPIYITNTGCFEGMFISRDVIEKIGFPDPEFFITWDDAIYGWQASKVTDVYYVDRYVLRRKRDTKNINLGIRHFPSASDLYRYFFIKNRPLVKNYLIKNDCYSPLLFQVGTFVILLKEISRIALIDRSWKSLLAIYRGYKKLPFNKDLNI